MSIGKKIEDLENYKKELDKLKTTERAVLKPTLEDLSLIPIIYSWVLELCATREEIETTNYNAYHYFIFIIAYLYSPRSFIDLPIKRGIRKELAGILGVYPQWISFCLSSARLWRREYPDFRLSIDYLYSEILLRIEIYKKV